MSPEQRDQLVEVERLFEFVAGTRLLSEADLARLAAIIVATRERLEAGEPGAGGGV